MNYSSQPNGIFNGKSIQDVIALSITENFFHSVCLALFSLGLTSLPTVEPLSPCASSGRRFWAKSARCGFRGTFSMPWTLWCWRRRKTRSRAVTSVALWGLILLWWPHPSPLSSVPDQERDLSFQRLRWKMRSWVAMHKDLHYCNDQLDAFLQQWDSLIRILLHFRYSLHLLFISAHFNVTNVALVPSPLSLW